MSFTGSTQQDRDDFVSEQRFIANRQHSEQWAKRPEIANLLTRRAALARDRRFTEEPLTGFGDFE